jgi:hypothetical protein
MNCRSRHKEDKGSHRNINGGKYAWPTFRYFGLDGSTIDLLVFDTTADCWLTKSSTIHNLSNSFVSEEIHVKYELFYIKRDEASVARHEGRGGKVVCGVICVGAGLLREVSGVPYFHPIM